MSDERFARQYRFGLPPGFLLASTCTSIVHHLSGPSAITLARCFTEDPTPPVIQFFENVSHFWLPCAWRFGTHKLAIALDSLARVSRRVKSNHRIRRS